jgi:predicted HTH transcriptional regulator
MIPDLPQSTEPLALFELYRSQVKSDLKNKINQTNEWKSFECTWVSNFFKNQTESAGNWKKHDEKNTCDEEKNV